MGWFEINAPTYQMDPTQPNMGFSGPMRSLSGAGALPPGFYDQTPVFAEYAGDPNAPLPPDNGMRTTGGQTYQPDVPHTVLVDGQPQPQGPGGIGMPPTGGGGVLPVPPRGAPRDQVVAYLQSVAQSKGIPWNSTSIDYWVDKFYSPEFNGDTAYWAGRVNTADEFTGGGQGMGGGLGSLDAPLLKGYGKEFNYDPNQILNSPAFAAAMKRGIGALENSAAARGTVLSGGILKDIADYTTGLGLNAINDDFGRSLDTASFNRGTQWGDTDRQFGRLMDFSQLGSSNASQLGNYGSQYGNQTGDVASQQSQNTVNLGTNEANAQLAGGSPLSPIQRPRYPGFQQRPR